MMQWWNNATIREFRERAQCFIDQYNRYKLDEVDQFVNGRMTQGENIADNGGLKQSYRVRIILCRYIALKSQQSYDIFLRYPVKCYFQCKQVYNSGRYVIHLYNAWLTCIYNTFVVHVD